MGTQAEVVEPDTCRHRKAAQELKSFVRANRDSPFYYAMGAGMAVSLGAVGAWVSKAISPAIEVTARQQGHVNYVLLMFAIVFFAMLMNIWLYYSRLFVFIREDPRGEVSSFVLVFAVMAVAFVAPILGRACDIIVLFIVLTAAIVAKMWFLGSTLRRSCEPSDGSPHVYHPLWNGRYTDDEFPRPQTLSTRAIRWTPYLNSQPLIRVWVLHASVWFFVAVGLYFGFTGFNVDDSSLMVGMTPDGVQKPAESFSVPGWFLICAVLAIAVRFLYVYTTRVIPAWEQYIRDRFIENDQEYFDGHDVH